MQNDWDYVFRIINAHSAAIDKILETEARTEREKQQRDQQMIRALEAIQQALLTLAGKSDVDRMLDEIFNKS